MATIVTRSGKGSQLTWTEVDDNFTNLNTDKIENVVTDTTPQLGGNLDTNTKNIAFGDSSVPGTDNTLIFGASNDLLIYHNTTNSVISEEGTGKLEIKGSQVDLTDTAGNVGVRASASDTRLFHLSSLRLQTTTTGITLWDGIDGQGHEVADIQLEDYAETVYSLGSTDSPTITVSNGNVQTVTITSGLSLPAFSDAATGQSVTLLVTGSGTATGTAAYKFAGGNTTLTSYSVVSVFYDGTTYWASIATDFQ
jgi:hypothetical protein